MSFGSFVPIDYENRSLQQIQQEKANYLQGQGTGANTINSLQSIARNYHWLSPGTALSLAQAGYNGYSPETMKAAQLEMTRKLRDHQYTQLLKDNKKSDFSKMTAAEYNAFSPAQRKQLREHAANVASQDVGGGGLFGTGIGPDYSASDFADTLPVVGSVKKLAEGDVSGALTAAIPGKVALSQIEGGAGHGIQSATKGTSLEPVVEGIKAGTREAGAIANTPLQYVQGEVRNKAADIAQIAQGNANLANVAGTLDPTGAVSSLTHSGAVPGLPHTGDTYKQTDVGQQGIAAVEGRNPWALGHGILPDANSNIGKAQSAAARAAAPTVQGHAFTLGRFAANQIFPAGGAPFDVMSGLVDAGVAVSADPVNMALSSFAAARRAGRIHIADPNVAQDIYGTTGQILDGDGTIDTAKGLSYLNTSAGQKAVRNSTKITSPSMQWRQGTVDTPRGVAQRKRISIPLAVALADSTTDAESAQAWRDEIGSPTLQGKFHMPTPGGLDFAFHKGVDSHRISSMLPGEDLLQVNNPDQNLHVADDIMAGMDMPVDGPRTEILDKYMRDSMDPTIDARGNLIEAVGKIAYHSMREHGLSDEAAANILKRFTNNASYGYAYTDARVGSTDPISTVLHVGDDVHIVPTDEEEAAFNHEIVPIPDMRALRRATSDLAPLLNNDLYKGSSSLADTLMYNWKALHLARPALAVKVIIDSQLSAAANGFNTPINHPMAWISELIASNNSDAWLARMARRFPGVKGPGENLDVLGNPLLDPADLEQQRKLYSGTSSVLSPDQIELAGKEQIPIQDARASKGLVSQVGALHQNPVARAIAGMTPAEAKEWFYPAKMHTADWYTANAAGRQLHDQILPIVNDMDNSFTAFGKAPMQYDLSTKPGSDAFIDNVYAHIESKTAGHPELLDAVRTGRINHTRETPLWSHGKINRHAVNQMEQLRTDALAVEGAPYVPGKVTAPAAIFDTHTDALAKNSTWNRAMNTLFDHLLTFPDAYWDRNPVLRQTYWGSIDRPGEIERTIPYLSEQDRAVVLSNAEKAGLPSEVLRRLQSTKSNPALRDNLTLEQHNLGAKANALDQVPHIVHDLHSRSQFFDMARMLFPFGDAFRRIAARWAHNVWENPNTLRRFQQAAQGANQSGFFHKDANGNMVFTYPGSSWLTDKMTGALSTITGQGGGGEPIPLMGAPKDLSMLGGGYPGVGPAVTLPASWFLKDTPGTAHELHQLLFPQGQTPPSVMGIPGDVVNQIIPSFASKLIQGVSDNYGVDQKAYNDTVGAMMNYKASTGHYDLNGKNAAAETARLLQDSKDAARFWYLVRGASQSVMPTTFSPEYKIHDKDGHLKVLDVVKKDYNEQLQKHGVDKALTWLFTRYGEDNIFVAQPFSQSIAYAAPTTRVGQDWIDNHSALAKKYPNTIGLFAPSEGKFSITAFERQFETGQRRTLSPEDQVKNAQSRVGLWIYHRVRDQIIRGNAGRSPDHNQALWLAGLREKLGQHYPGFGLVQYDTTRLPQGIAELTKASQDPELANTDAGKGLSTYLAIRQYAMDQGVNGYGFTSGNSIFTANSALPIREWLRDAATSIIDKHPSFLPMYEQLFSHEMKYDPTVGR